MSLCKNCQRELPDLEGKRFCPFCGADLDDGIFEYDARAADQERTQSEIPHSGETEVSSSEQETDSAEEAVPELEQGSQPDSDRDPEKIVHWEERSRFGFLASFGQTVSDSMLRPSDFFQRRFRREGVGSAFLFAFLIWMTSGLLAVALQKNTLDADIQRVGDQLGIVLGENFVAQYALMLPMIVVILLFVWATVMHVSLLMVGSGRGGWSATFRAICYSSGPRFLVIIPFWGSFLIASVWQLTIMIIGLSKLHDSSTGRVVFATVLPLLLCCGLPFVMVVAMMSSVALE